MHKTLKNVYDSLKSRFSEHEARLILAKRAKISWAELIAGPEREISADILALIEQDSARRSQGEPLSRIYGERQFYGLDFMLSPDTLDPRPETELLIDLALKKAPGALQTLDLGTGTGCLAITMLKYLPAASCVAVDKSLRALNTARQNAARHGVAGRFFPLCSDWAAAIKGPFDLILSNPPYIQTNLVPNLSVEVKNHDPILALDGGQNGLEAYKIIFLSLKKLLKPGGIALFEIGFDQAEDAERLAGESGLSCLAIHTDYAGLPRVAEITCGDK